MILICISHSPALEHPNVYLPRHILPLTAFFLLSKHENIANQTKFYFTVLNMFVMRRDDEKIFDEKDNKL